MSGLPLPFTLLSFVTLVLFYIVEWGTVVGLLALTVRHNPSFGDKLSDVLGLFPFWTILVGLLWCILVAVPFHWQLVRAVLFLPPYDIPVIEMGLVLATTISLLAGIGCGISDWLFTRKPGQKNIFRDNLKVFFITTTVVMVIPAATAMFIIMGHYFPR